MTRFNHSQNKMVKGYKIKDYGKDKKEVRQMIGEYLGYLGTGVDPKKNDVRGEEVIISMK